MRKPTLVPRYELETLPESGVFEVLSDRYWLITENHELLFNPGPQCNSVKEISEKILGCYPNLNLKIVKIRRVFLPYDTSERSYSFD